MCERKGESLEEIYMTGLDRSPLMCERKTPMITKEIKNVVSIARL